MLATRVSCILCFSSFGSCKAADADIPTIPHFSLGEKHMAERGQVVQPHCTLGGYQSMFSSTHIAFLVFYYNIPSTESSDYTQK